MRILVVDDEPAVRDSLDRALRLDGYDVDLAADGGEGRAKLRCRIPDAIVLDVLMPVVDGITFCRELRAEGCTVPVLMLTARDGVSDRVAGLDAGADDYLVKPFALEELQARLRAMLRRTKPSGVLAFEDVSLDTGTYEVQRGGRQIVLTRTEFELLELLVRNAGIVLDHAVIYERIWNYDFGPDSKNLAVYIGYLRRKIDTGDLPKLIHTVRGVGYTVRAS